VQFVFSLILILSVSVWGADIQIPTLSSPVMDEAGFLSTEEREDLSQLAYEIYTHQGPQITILTVKDLQGYAIEDFSIRVAEKWKLGTKEKGNGLLILIAKTEKQMRIEVGQGIEGEITDYESNQYIRNILAPAFKKGLFHDGLRLVLQDIAQKFNIELQPSSGHIRRSTRAPTAIKIPEPLRKAFPFLIGILVVGHLLLNNKPGFRGLFTGTCLASVGIFMGVEILLIIFIFIIGLLVGIIGLHNILFAILSNGGRGGGGFGGGSSGGSWSGGGGGFSGGGSSGNW
jgi:uncharacterized protein